MNMHKISVLKLQRQVNSTKQATILQNETKNLQILSENLIADG